MNINFIPGDYFILILYMAVVLLLFYKVFGVIFEQQEKKNYLQTQIN